MKKTLAVIIALLCMFAILSTSNKALALTDYYDGTEGLSGEELLNELASITQKNHTVFNSYGQIRQMNAISDQDPNNSSKLIDFYSGISVDGAWDGGTTWNREHVWPQSLSGGLYGESGAGADVHHIRPTISSINSSRGNKLFTDFDVIGQTFEEKKYDGTLVAYTNNSYWEPLDNVKGDVARILMYLYMHYSKEVAANKSFTYAGSLAIQNVVYSGNGAEGAWDILLDWNDLDPVDEFEMNRNEYCASVTKARNPFIDNEEYARLIWDEGNTTDKQRFTVTYHVGENATFNYSDNSRYLEGSKVKVPTITPTLDGYRFVDWYRDSEFSIKWNFETDLITTNIDLYAKFSELTFSDIFENLDIKSQLVFDIVKEDNAVEMVSKEMSITNFTNGEGTLSKTNYNLAEYLEFDTTLFEITYNHNNANNAYISASKKEIRLYPAGGNGSSIDITAKDGVKITNIKYTNTKLTPSVSISSDGKTAKIQNTTSATSGSDNQSIIKSIIIVYETESKGYSYSIKDGSLAIKYVLSLTETEYYKFILSNEELTSSINNEEVLYDVVKYGDNYRIVCTIYIDEYTIVYTPIFEYDSLILTFDGYSAKSLAQRYLNTLSSDAMVKEYQDCLLGIIS